MTKLDANAIEALKPGDPVAYTAGQYGRREMVRIGKVERLTNTQLILVNNSRFYRSGRNAGKEVGASSNSYYSPSVLVSLDDPRVMTTFLSDGRQKLAAQIVDLVNVLPTTSAESYLGGLDQLIELIELSRARVKERTNPDQ